MYYRNLTLPPFSRICQNTFPYLPVRKVPENLSESCVSLAKHICLKQCISLFLVNEKKCYIVFDDNSPHEIKRH